jgi:hypothetical protein
MIQLQTHGGEIAWRNIFLREIPADEANQILSKKGAEGFKPIFDGKTLANWDGAVDNYEVVDGAIRCKAGKGGTLYEKTELTDFAARVEFLLPPGGNNGLAIRYSGTGNPAFDGMTELQVLDDTAEKYAKLDPRQYHGSAYGLAAAHRGYLRPVGQWNFQEVTVQGSRVRVELNGTVILDADLAPITTSWRTTPTPARIAPPASSASPATTTPSPSATSPSSRWRSDTRGHRIPIPHRCSRDSHLPPLRGEVDREAIG